MLAVMSSIQRSRNRRYAPISIYIQAWPKYFTVELLFRQICQARGVLWQRSIVHTTRVST